MTSKRTVERRGFEGIATVFEVKLYSGGFTSGEKIWHEFRVLVMHSSRNAIGSLEKSRESDAAAKQKGSYNFRMVPRSKQKSSVVEVVIPKASKVHNS
ncbi:hypothetical protein COCNU_01G014680 [Cocos nucifera]|uniref:Uncharacterized protein n=1 Tax=Cocos nucifera TaxID=13894 RepID=A0A8K0MVC3_COCNU|nr:hypothetical protein COCNU_01G014680 [Cocos nucifera]